MKSHHKCWEPDETEYKIAEFQMRVRVPTFTRPSTMGTM